MPISKYQRFSTQISEYHSFLASISLLVSISKSKHQCTVKRSEYQNIILFLVKYQNIRVNKSQYQNITVKIGKYQVSENFRYQNIRNYKSQYQNIKLKSAKYRVSEKVVIPPCYSRYTDIPAWLHRRVGEAITARTST